MSTKKVGFADDLLVTDFTGDVQIMGPPREVPRRWWVGTEEAALELLATLSDDAGIEAFWAAFARE